MEQARVGMQAVEWSRLGNKAVWGREAGCGMEQAGEEGIG